MISEGQRNDINYAIPLLDHIEIDGSKVLADRGYDSNQFTRNFRSVTPSITFTIMAVNQPFHPAEELNLNVAAIGGFIRKDIWSKITF